MSLPINIFEEYKSRRITLVKAEIYVLALILAYYSVLEKLIFIDWAREDYSHCCLIPFVVLYLIREKRETLLAIPSNTSWAGMLPFSLALILFWIGELGGELFSLYISMWFVLVGLIWLHLGWDKIKALAFPLFMILTMFPFPYFINNRILLNLKLISSQLGVKLLQLYGMSVYREGNIIDLGFTKLQVVDACSGLRFVFPIMVLSLLLAYWFKAHLWKKIILFLSSVPLAVFANSFRIAATGILYSMFGAKVAEGFFHGFSAWIIFMLTIPLLLLEMWLLRLIPPKYEGLKDRNIRYKVQGSRNKVDEEVRGKGLLSPIFVTTVAILLLTFAVSHMVNFREKVPIKRSFSHFPLSIGEWKGTKQSIEQKFIDELDLSEYILTSFRNPRNREVNFYVAYYESQRTGESIHSPESCFPASGWITMQEGTTGITIDNGRKIEVNRTIMSKGGSRELVYFWFPMRGRILTNIYQMKFYGFLDALTKRRTDGALVRLVTTVYTDEEIKDADLRLQGFAKEIVPVLNQFLPN